MKFLTKLGQLLIQGSKIIAGIAPLFPQYESAKIVDTLIKITDVIINIEAFGQVLNIPGAEKLKAASPLVAQIILKSDILVGHKINDQALFKAGIDKITGGMADVLNSLDADSINTVS